MRETIETSTTGHSRPSGGTARRRAGSRSLLALAAVCALLGGTVTSASAADVGAPGTPITALPFFGGGDVTGIGTGTPGTGAANASVSATCNAGVSIDKPQWYTLPPVAMSKVVARVDAPFYPRGVDQNPSGVAFVDATTGAVLACGPGPVSAGAGHAVSVVAYYSQSVAACEAEDAWCHEGSLRLYVNSVAPAPANDHWADATAITSLPFTASLDTSLAAADGPRLVDYEQCELSAILPRLQSTAWWSYTPTTTGPLTLSVDLTSPWGAVGPFVGTRVRTAIALATSSGPVLAPRTDPSDCESPTVLQAGTPYLIAVFLADDAYYDATLVPGGPLTLRVGQPRLPRVPTTLQVTTDSAARTATLSWSPPVSSGSSTVTGYRVTRRGAGATSRPWSAILPASARSYTFGGLTPWAMHHLSVQAVTAGGRSVPATVTVSPSAATPSAPTGVTASATVIGAVVRWAPPAQPGTSAVTGYRIRTFSRDTGRVVATRWVSAKARSFLVTGLKRGAVYSVDLTAVNSSGLGQASARSSASRR